ncbi:LAQU0S03e06568g1_1 [Lachancea quebecensis]|uniref:LAQU0S03e06568g1_1 n=1 Tax=Lachancea quebecensis TaxID=1654605 RepID=A0A0P1KRS8_9SACH|nr:LAQU0S03e06568g1_1 [Lachancea quebecensis]
MLIGKAIILLGLEAVLVYDTQNRKRLEANAEICPIFSTPQHLSAAHECNGALFGSGLDARGLGLFVHTAGIASMACAFHCFWKRAAAGNCKIIMDLGAARRTSKCRTRSRSWLVPEARFYRCVDTRSLLNPGKCSLAMADTIAKELEKSQELSRYG